MTFGPGSPKLKRVDHDYNFSKNIERVTVPLAVTIQKNDLKKRLNLDAYVKKNSIPSVMFFACCPSLMTAIAASATNASLPSSRTKKKSSISLQNHSKSLAPHSWGRMSSFPPFSPPPYLSPVTHHHSCTWFWALRIRPAHTPKANAMWDAPGSLAPSPARRERKKKQTVS